MAPFRAIKEIRQLNEVVYQQILEAILDGSVKLGTRLPVDEIARQIGVSTTPVREALGRLTKEGLVNKIPYQGYAVRGFDTKEISDIFEVRAALESYAAYLCAQRRTTEDIKWLKELQRAGYAALQENDFVAYSRYNSSLHQELLKISRNDVLTNMWKTIHNQIMLFASRTIKVQSRPPKAFLEHQQMIEAIENQDGSQSSQVMNSHILSARDDMLKAVEMETEYQSS